MNKWAKYECALAMRPVIEAWPTYYRDMMGKEWPEVCRLEVSLEERARMEREERNKNWEIDNWMPKPKRDWFGR